MKSKMLILLMSTLIYPALAQTQVELSLNTSIYVKYSEKRTYKHSVDCYWKKRGDEFNPLAEKVLSGSSVNGVYSQNITLTSKHLGSSPFPLNPRTLEVEIKNEKFGAKNEAQVSLNDKVNTGVMWHTLDGTGCLKVYGYATATKPIIHGVVKFKYKVPENTWLIKVTRSSYNEFFKFERSSHFTDIINSEDDKATPKEIYLWVQPGQIIQQSFKIKSYVSGNRHLGKYKISFEPVGDIDQTLEAFRNRIVSTLKGIASMQIKKDANNLPVLINNFWSLIRTISKDKKKQLLMETPNQDIKKLSEDLFEFSNADILGGRDAMVAKMSAAILGYEVGGYILSEFNSYCHNVNLYLPIRDQERVVLGIRAAYFWISRARDSLTGQNYADVKRFIKDLVINQSNNRTYKDVMADVEERRRLRESEKRISNFSGVFLSAQHDIDLVIRHFGNFGAPNASGEIILMLLDDLVKAEKQFKAQYFRHLDKYTYYNENKVNVVSLLESLESLEEKKMILTDELSKNVRFLSYSENASTNSFMAELTNIIAHQTNLITGELNDATLEAVRTTYIKSRNLKEIAEETYQCVKGGL